MFLINELIDYTMLVIELIKRYKLATSFLVATFYVHFILPINESIAFELPLTNKTQFFVSRIYKLVFVFVLTFIIYFILHFLFQFKKNRQYKLWLRLSTLYALLNILLFILIYPGFWVWDELYVLKDAQSYSLEAWQHIFTNMYHTFCLYLIPTGVGIVIIQVLIVSVIVGYVLSKSIELLSYKPSSSILCIPFLFVPVLINNLYPLRLTLYAFLELFLLFSFLLLLTKKHTSINTRVDYLGFSLLATVLAFWRTEGIIYLLLIPIFGQMLGIFDFTRPIKSLKDKSVLIFIIPLLFIAAASLITIKTTSPKYQIPPSLGALSMLLSNSDTNKVVVDKSDIATINHVIDVHTLVNDAAYNDVPVLFWQGKLKPGFENNIRGYQQAFLKIALRNPIEFIKVKAKTFFASNSLDSHYTPHIGNGIRFSEVDNTEFNWLFGSFYASNKLSRPWDLALKLNITRSLLGINNRGQLIQPYAALVWTVIPTLLFVLFLLGYSLIYKKWAYAIVLSLIVAKAILIFVSAPAGFFMYYFPTYIIGNFLVIFMLLNLNYPSEVHRKR